MRVAFALVAIGLVAAPAAHATTPVLLTADCAHRSIADFPAPIVSPRNLVVGPLAFIGGRDAAHQTPATIKRIGGWKTPALVRAGRTVTVRIGRAARSWVTMNFAPRESYGVRFVACRGDSGSHADGRPVTFWAGRFEMPTRTSGCIPLEIRIGHGRWRHRTLAVATDC